MRKLFLLILALFVSISAQAATGYYDTIAVDADSTEAYTAASRSTLTHSHTSVGTPSSIFCWAWTCGNTISSMAYDGQAMTELTEWSSVDSTGVRVYYLTSPHTGTKNLVVTLGATATTSGFAGCETLTGTATSPANSNVTAQDSIIPSTSFNMTLSSAGAGDPDWYIAALAIYPLAPDTVVQTSDDQLSNYNITCGANYYSVVVSRERIAGNRQITYSWSNPFDATTSTQGAIMAARQSIISPTVSGTIASDSNFVTTKGCQVLR